MLELLNLKTEAFGLHFSDSSLKFAKLKKKGEFFDLASFGTFSIEEGVIKNGEIKSKKDLIKVIKNFLKKSPADKLKTNYVIASLPEEKSFLQVIQLPLMPEENVRSAVVYEAENYIPLPIEDVYLDFQIIKPVVNHLDHLDVLIAAAPKEIVNNYLFCLKEAGLKPKALETESLALCRALIKKEFSPSPLLLADIGKTKTNFIIFGGYSLHFASSGDISGQTKIGFWQTEKLKIEYGSPKKEENKEASLVKKTALNNLVEQIKNYIDYYNTHFFHEHFPSGKKTLEKILLCGEMATTPGLIDFLSAELHLSVEKANPFINILEKPEKGGSKLSLEDSLPYAVVLGLALRGVKEL